MKKTTIIIGLMLIIGLIITSCGDDDSAATLSITYDFNVGSEPFELGKIYTINETAVSFDAANFYIGGVIITQEDGSVIDLSENYLLAGLNNRIAINGDFPVSNITKVDYFIGVDPITNAQTEEDFTTRTADDPLSIKDPSMHWNWNTGYKFLRVDGDADTDGDGMPDTGIAYHIGSDPFLVTMSDTEGIDIKGGSNTLSFTFDLEQFFDGVDLATEIDTHTGNNLPLANRLKANMATAIDLK